MVSLAKIREIANELDCLLDESTAYFNRQTGEVYT
jgi:hypothetical protein